MDDVGENSSGAPRILRDPGRLRFGEARSRRHCCNLKLTVSFICKQTNQPWKLVFYSGLYSNLDNKFFPVLVLEGGKVNLKWRWIDTFQQEVKVISGFFHNWEFTVNMALRKIVPSTLRPIISLMSQTSQLTSKIFHLPPPSSSPPPPLPGRELQDLVSVTIKQMTEMFQLFDVKMQNRFDQVMQQQQDLLQQLQVSSQKHEDFCLNIAIVSQGLAEQVDAVAVDESYPHLDYDLTLEKVLETTEDLKTYWKSWRKLKEAILEPYIDSLIMNQAMEQGITEEKLSNPEQAFIHQDIHLKETETFILGENVETTKPTNFIQSYLHLLDNFDDQQLIVTDLFQLLKTTKIDTQTQSSRKYNKVDNNLFITSSKSPYNTQMILVEREKNFVQFELIRKFCNQILGFDNRKVLIWDPTWHRKKARVRYKRVI